MTYTFPKILAPLREFLRGQGADVKSFVSARQAAFVAQQLIGSRVKFPPQGQDMTSTLLSIQEVMPKEGVKPLKSLGAHGFRGDAQKAGKSRNWGKKFPEIKNFRPEMFAEGIHFFCDGAAVPNPGAGGWAWVMYIDGQEFSYACGGDPETTNNIMEMTGLLNAIEKAAKLVMVPKPEKITIWCDSQYCVEGVNTWLPTWKARGWNKRKLNSPKRDDGGIKNLDLWKAIDAAMTGAEGVSIRWVKGHIGIVGNERADELAEIGRQDACETGSRGGDSARHAAASGAHVASAPGADDLDAEYRAIMAG